MNINAKITISRPSYGSGKKAISITITDEESRVRFFDGEMSYESFIEALTGMGECPVDATVRGLEFIGKQRINEPRTIECPLNTYKKDELENWLSENAQEEGWLQ